MTDKEIIEEMAHELYSKQDEYDMSNPFEVAKCICNLGYCKKSETVKEIYYKLMHDFIGLDEIGVKVLKSILKNYFGVEVEK